MSVSEGLSGLYAGQFPRHVEASGFSMDWAQGGGGVYIAGVVSGTSEAVTVTVKGIVTVSYTVGGVVS